MLINIQPEGMISNQLLASSLDSQQYSAINNTYNLAHSAKRRSPTSYFEPRLTVKQSTVKAAVARRANASQQPHPPRLIHANSIRRRKNQPDKVYANFKFLQNGNNGGEMMTVGERPESLASTLVTQSVNITRPTFGKQTDIATLTHFAVSAISIDQGLSHLNKLEQVITRGN